MEKVHAAHPKSGQAVTSAGRLPRCSARGYHGGISPRLLNTVYGDGLLSEETLAHRLDQVFAERLIEPLALIGDLRAHSR